MRLPLTVSLLIISQASGFVPSRQCVLNRCKKLGVVTAEQVVQIVEAAEELWEKAHEARKTANALSDRAEEEAEAASSLAEESQARMREGAISLEKISDHDAATVAHLDASSMVSKALEATDEADRLEALAEEKLKESEEALAQHLIDFPDSPLA